MKNFFDVNSGVCHQVLPEHGFVKPGMLVIGADSHTCTHGAFGAFATGVGSTDMGAVLARGKTWLRVPETIKVNVNGRLDKYVHPKDVILRIAKEIGVSGATYMTLEYHGDVVRDMSVAGRMTLCNMAIEMGGKAGICEADQKTVKWLDQRTTGPYDMVKADKDASLQADTGPRPHRHGATGSLPTQRGQCEKRQRTQQSKDQSSLHRLMHQWQTRRPRTSPCVAQRQAGPP